MPSYKPHEEPPSPPPYNESDLRPDQKRCRRCKASLILEQRRCPFCGNAPWYWNPNARFLVAAIVVALFVLLLLPFMNQSEPTHSTRATDLKYRSRE